MKNQEMKWSLLTSAATGVLVLALTGCTAMKPLKGGKATMTSKPAGGIEQTVVQSENPAQTSRQRTEAAMRSARARPS